MRNGFIKLFLILTGIIFSYSSFASFNAYGPPAIISLSFKLCPQGAFYSNFPFGLSYLTKHRYDIDYPNMKLVVNPEVTLIWQVSMYLSLEVGTALINKGSEITDTMEGNYPNIKYYGFKRTFMYFSVPAFLKFHYPLKYQRLYFSTGITNSLLLYSTEYRKYEEDENKDIDLRSFSNPTEFSLVTGGGIEFAYKMKYSYNFELTFSKGLTSFMSDGTEQDLSYKHYLLGVKLGITYNFTFSRFRE